jgi:peptide/nickel transport system permease protein
MAATDDTITVAITAVPSSTLRSRPRLTSANALLMTGAVVLVVLLLIGALVQFIAPFDPITMDVVNALKPPSAEHWLGTDRFGRDVLSRILWGTRSSLVVSFISVALAVLVGSGMGILAGYYQGPLDMILSRVMDVFFGFPTLLLAITIAAMLPPSDFNVVLAIAIVFVPRYFRIARAPVLAEKTLEYIDAARAVGAGDMRLIVRHLIPNTLSAILIQAALGLSAAILIEASLGYLGLGVKPPAPSWGTMLNEGRTFVQNAPWLSIFPGLAIMLAVLAFNLVADGLRDLLDPRMRGRM